MNRFVNLGSFLYVWHLSTRNKDSRISLIHLQHLYPIHTSHRTGPFLFFKSWWYILHAGDAWTTCLFMLAMYMYTFFPVYCTLWVLTWANLPASTAFEPRVCGTKSPSKELLVAHRELLSDHRQLKARDQPSETMQAQIVIDTYIHFVTTKDQAPFYSANFLSYAYDNQVCLFLLISLVFSFFL